MQDSEQSLPEPSLSGGLNLSLRGFADEEVARRFGQRMGDAVHMVSRWIDLSRLDGVTVATITTRRLRNSIEAIPMLRL
jgi:hypothetical protein